ncbi:hypothetical protein [Cysteiniphilum sp. QT6929]|uniref:hypothetical protein n=1 Tax=Cysteiniphilum sp. QT6929 TaxID=2975055 RepID=UPI0024B3A75A|nr:hypothetical protein [Cysteiniphilum sp. QT6929]WHN65393.1 hypothetical protein NYP54_10195 [Cysteiniphilum sp. QT6929]
MADGKESKETIQNCKSKDKSKNSSFLPREIVSIQFLEKLWLIGKIIFIFSIVLGSLVVFPYILITGVNVGKLELSDVCYLIGISMCMGFLLLLLMYLMYVFIQWPLYLLGYYFKNYRYTDLFLGELGFDKGLLFLSTLVCFIPYLTFLLFGVFFAYNADVDLFYRWFVIFIMIILVALVLWVVFVFGLKKGPYCKIKRRRKKIYQYSFVIVCIYIFISLVALFVLIFVLIESLKQVDMVTSLVLTGIILFAMLLFTLFSISPKRLNQNLLGSINIRRFIVFLLPFSFIYLLFVTGVGVQLLSIKQSKVDVIIKRSVLIPLIKVGTIEKEGVLKKHLDCSNNSQFCTLVSVDILFQGIGSNTKIRVPLLKDRDIVVTLPNSSIIAIYDAPIKAHNKTDTNKDKP